MPFAKDRPNIVCGICGAEVIQVGGFMKCQNIECKMEIPLDIDSLRDIGNISILENASQGNEMN